MGIVNTQAWTDDWLQKETSHLGGKTTLLKIQHIII